MRHGSTRIVNDSVRHDRCIPPRVASTQRLQSPPALGARSAAHLALLACVLGLAGAGCGNQGSLQTGNIPDGAIVYADGRVVWGDGGLAPGTCADVAVNTRRVIPTVVVMVDRSGSMTEDFGGDSRWNTMRDALVGPGGIIQEFEGNVSFGLAMYTGLDEGPVLECPSIAQIDPAMMNFAAIRDVYRDAEPLQETPTGDAMEAVLDHLLGLPDPIEGPIVILLATDGEPDTCEMPNPQRGQDEAIAAARRGYASGIRTFMLSVGEDVSAEHMQAMANTGVGRGRGEPDAPYWVAGDDAGLRSALRSIIGGEVSCDLELRGRIDPEYACEGSVRMYGRDRALECGTEWEVLDENTIRLLGEACETLLSSPGTTVEATFPCHSVLI